VLAAAVSEMQFGHFLLAIFSGRCVRFLVLSFLTLRFGPGFVDFSGRVFRQHFHWVLAAVAVGLGIWLLIRRARLARKNLTAENAKESLSSQRTA
jgi:membrane protein DedA with SNARE-associated domain